MKRREVVSLLGGAAGSFVGPDALEVPLTFEALRAIGATLGSGVVLVLDDMCNGPEVSVRGLCAEMIERLDKLDLIHRS